MKRLPGTTAALWLSFASLASLAGCADVDADATAASAATSHALEATDPDPSGGQLRLVHASAASGAFDVYAGTSSTPLWTGVSFGSATAYAALPAGDVQLVFRSAGASADAAPLYTSEIIAVHGGDVVTTVAGGLLGTSVASARFRVQAFAESFAAANPGTRRVRFVQESHALASTSFDLGADGSSEIVGLGSFGGSDAAGVELRATARPLQLVVSTGTPARKLTAFTLPPELLAADDSLFLVLVGVPTFLPRDTRGLALLAVGHGHATLVRQNPTVYVLPAIPDAAGIDLYAFGRGIGAGRVAENAPMGALVAPLQVPPSASGYGFLITEADANPGDGLSGQPLGLASTGPLLAGERYLAVASGFAHGDAAVRPHVTLSVTRDGFATQIGKGRVRALAAAADAPSVDVGQFAPGENTAFTVLAGAAGLTYGATSAEPGVEVDAVPLNPGVRPSGASDAWRFRFGALSSVERAFAVVAGAFAPLPGDVGVRVIVVKTIASGNWTAQVLSPQ